MKLELNVVRFNNEDVIATSIEIDCTGRTHVMKSNVICSNTDGSHNKGVNLIYTSDAPNLKGGKVSCMTQDFQMEINVWYNYDKETESLVKCTMYHDYNPTFSKDDHYGPNK